MKNGAKRQRARHRLELGQHIVSDSGICHGKVTFRGTRIFVADVLADVAEGLSWDFIIRRWGAGKLTKIAIAEALQLSRAAWLDEDGRLTPEASKGRLPKAA